MSAHTLTSGFRKFETFGLVTRSAYAEVPPRVVYALTPLGHDRRSVLEEMNHWALQVPVPSLGTEIAQGADESAPMRL
ncbi:DNA-binding HxlR family transcriptional regulator [Arthrobacter sp. CAN_C5]|nr:DNA-binding HxlR family transcriptional regulator [Arthrobacter sp. CAN_C5]